MTSSPSSLWWCQLHGGSSRGGQPLALARGAPGIGGHAGQGADLVFDETVGRRNDGARVESCRAVQPLRGRQHHGMEDRRRAGHAGGRLAAACDRSSRPTRRRSRRGYTRSSSCRDTPATFQSSRPLETGTRGSPPRPKTYSRALSSERTSVTQIRGEAARRRSGASGPWSRSRRCRNEATMTFRASPPGQTWGPRRRARRASPRRCRASGQDRHTRRAVERGQPRAHQEALERGHPKLGGKHDGGHVLGPRKRAAREERTTIAAVIVARECRGCQPRRLESRRTAHPASTLAGMNPDSNARAYVNGFERGPRLARRERADLESCRRARRRRSRPILPTPTTPRSRLSSTTTATLAAPCRSSACR